MKMSDFRGRVCNWIDVQRHNSRVILNDVAIRETFATLRRFAVFGLALFVALWVLGWLIVRSSQGAAQGAAYGFWGYAFSISRAGLRILCDIQGISTSTRR